MKTIRCLLVVSFGLAGSWVTTSFASDSQFNGLGPNLGNLYRVSKAQTRSISPENFTGEKGKGGMATEGTGKHAARELGQGWKVSPSVDIKAGSTFTLAEIKGPGCIQQIWMTPTGNWRHSILRFYWDDETEPSVECPVGDFFACGWGKYCQINSLAVCVNPGSAFNCYWQMPFRKKARITMENMDQKDMTLYYQVNYTLTAVPKDAGYFHAQFRREAPLRQKGIYTILDGVKGQGQYVGTYLAWGTAQQRLVGRGRDQVLHGWRQGIPHHLRHRHGRLLLRVLRLRESGNQAIREVSTPYTGLAQVIPPDKMDEPGMQLGLYRWHITDPVRFEKDLKVTIQALGWQSEDRYLQLEDDIASVAYWYQKEPHGKFPRLPDGL